MSIKKASKMQKLSEKGYTHIVISLKLKEQLKDVAKQKGMLLHCFTENLLQKALEDCAI